MGLPKVFDANKLRGRKSSRSSIKQLLMLLIIDREGPIGRYRLKKMLGMNEHEGIVRQMLRELKEGGHLTADRLGSRLTRKGRERLQEELRRRLIARITDFDTPVFSTRPFSIGLQLQNSAGNIDSAIKIRDIAVRGGASGATTMLYTDNALTIPSVDTGFLSSNPRIKEVIHETFSLENRDVITIITADTKWRGFEAALRVAEALAPK